jgi:hypothetical protein
MLYLLDSRYYTGLSQSLIPEIWSNSELSNVATDTKLDPTTSSAKWVTTSGSSEPAH